MQAPRARTPLSSQSLAHERMPWAACLRRLVSVTALLLVIPGGRIASVDMRLLASPAMDYALVATIAGVCAVATLLVLFDHASRAQRARLRLLRAWSWGLQRAQRRSLLRVVLHLERAVRRRVRQHAAAAPPPSIVGGRPLPCLALCRRLQRGQRPRVPAAGGCFLGRR